MKSTVISLLVAILVIGLANLAAALGIFSSGAPDYEYMVQNAAQMDNRGFRSIALEDGKEPDEEGLIRLSREDIQKDERAWRVNLIPRTVMEVEKEGGWTLVSVTRDFDYIFRRKK